MLDDAEVVLTAYGISARICKSAIQVLREEGIKVGLVRPITLFPFPYEAYDKLNYDKIKFMVNVEMSMPPQFYEDVCSAVKDRAEIKLCLSSGGTVINFEDIVDLVRKGVKGE